MASRITPEEASTILELSKSTRTVLAIAQQVGRARATVKSVLDRGGPPTGHIGRRPADSDCWWDQPIAPNGTVGPCPVCGHKMHLCHEGLCARCILLRGLKARRVEVGT